MKKKIRKRLRTHKKKSNFKVYLVVMVLAVVFFVVAAWFFRELLSQKASNDWSEAKSVVAEGGRIVLPKDDAPHQVATSEWWSYHGRLTSLTGQRYSFDYTATLSADSKGQVLINAGLNDFQTGQHYGHRIASLQNVRFDLEDHFDLVSNGHIMVGGNGDDHIKVIADAFTFDLTLKGIFDPIFHGNKGVISFGVLGDSNYYSRTRLATSGTVMIDGKLEEVKGVTWFDHQWGGFSVNQLSWDWFGLQLADGSDLMLYQLKDQAGRNVFVGGSITQNAVTEVLLNTDFSLTPTAKWASAKTGVIYPVEWRVSIPRKNIDIVARSIVKNSELEVKTNQEMAECEGVVSVLGSHLGQGFMRLQGYARKH